MKNFSVQTIITIIAVLAIMGIALSDKADITYILPVLGGFCLALGIIGLVKLRKDEEKKGSPSRCLLQIILGGFIAMLGIIEIANITLGQNFWNLVLVVIVVIAVIWMILRRRDAFKNH